MSGTLYLIPNTLGQSEALGANILAQVIPNQVQAITASMRYFIAENAKTTRAYLKLIAQICPLTLPLQEIQIAELNVNTNPNELPALLSPLLNGIDGALISEAGVPAVADPGANLIRLAHSKGISVKPLVGPSSLLLALMASGLNGQSFAFNGYLPIEPEPRIKKIKALEERSRLENQTQLFIETPYRNANLLETLSANCRPSTLICIATDLSLPTETITMQSATQWKQTLDAKKGPDFHKKPTVFLFLAS